MEERPKEGNMARSARMRGVKSIRADQAWFWSGDWQAGEHRVDDEMASGRGNISLSTEEFLESLD